MSISAEASSFLLSTSSLPLIASTSKNKLKSQGGRFWKTHIFSSSDTLQIILGAHDLHDSETTKKVFENPIVIVHENFTGSYYDDIALVKLDEYVELTDAIAPISEMADSTAGKFLGNTAVLSGWGKLYSW